MSLIASPPANTATARSVTTRPRACTTTPGAGTTADKASTRPVRCANNRTADAPASDTIPRPSPVTSNP